MFPSLCNEHGRERYHKYETHFYTGLAQIANVKAGIRVTDVALGLRRVPSGFYAMVHHSGYEWKTENKCSSVNDDVVEWSGPIPL